MKLDISIILVGVLLAAATVTATLAVNETQGQSAPPYRSVFEAVMGIPEVDQVKSMLVDFLTSPTGLTPPIVARYQYIIPIAQGRESTITAFIPLNKAYEAMQLYTCMTTEELNDFISTNPKEVADTTEQVLANTTAPVSEKDFRDGLRLPTFKEDVELRLRRRNNTDGSISWIIPKMNFDGSDIVINTTDIPTGKAILHLTDGIITSDAQKAVYANLSREYCSRPGAKQAAEASIAKAIAARATQAQTSPVPSPSLAMASLPATLPQPKNNVGSHAAPVLVMLVTLAVLLLLL